METWGWGGAEGEEGGDTSMAQDAYFFANTRFYPRVSGIQIDLEFRGFMFLFGTSYVALFNGRIVSDIRILVTHVYCLSEVSLVVTCLGKCCSTGKV